MVVAHIGCFSDSRLCWLSAMFLKYIFYCVAQQRNAFLSPPSLTDKNFLCIINMVLMNYRLGFIRCKHIYLLVGAWTKKFAYGMLTHQNAYYSTISVILLSIPLCPKLLLHCCRIFLLFYCLYYHFTFIHRSPHCIHCFSC